MHKVHNVHIVRFTSYLLSKHFLSDQGSPRHIGGRTDFAQLLLCHTKTDLCLALNCTNQILKNYALLCTLIF